MALSKEQIQQVIGEGVQSLMDQGVLPLQLELVNAIQAEVSDSLVNLFEAQSGMSGLPIRTFTEFNPLGDVVSNVQSKVSTPLWSGNKGTLESFYTNSNASVDIVKSNTLPYYLNVYHEDPAGTATQASQSAAQFSIAYAHVDGGGYTAASGVNRKQPTKAIYSQYRSLLIGYQDPYFTINGVDKKHVYIININRGRIKERLDPGNWELRLSGSISGNGNHRLNLIDDSGQGKSAIGSSNNPIAGGGSRVYNIVSGTISVSDDDATFGVQQGNNVYGLVYPDIGVILLDPDQVSASVGTPSTTGVGGYFTSESGDYATQNLQYLYNIMGGNSDSNGISGETYDNGGVGFRARSEEDVTSTHYFCRIQNKDYNFSNNPTFFTSSDGSFTNDSFYKDPKVYITTVGLYNENFELLAVAKLSQPLQKSFAKEAVVKVKLDF